jgi:hypothetical protein
MKAKNLNSIVSLGYAVKGFGQIITGMEAEGEEPLSTQ